APFDCVLEHLWCGIGKGQLIIGSNQTISELDAACVSSVHDSKRTGYSQARRCLLHEKGAYFLGVMLTASCNDELVSQVCMTHRPRFATQPHSLRSRSCYYSRRSEWVHTAVMRQHIDAFAAEQLPQMQRAGSLVRPSGKQP